MKTLVLALLFAATTTVAAQPLTITAVSPSSVDTAGGVEVTITGSGFAMCVICSPPLPPPEVLFGMTPSPRVVVVDENTIRAVVPAHLPGTVLDVSVSQFGVVTLPDALTFTGNVEEAFDRLLLPLFTGPIDGAFGSRFITELRLANSSSTTSTSLFGLIPECRTAVCTITEPLEQPYGIHPNGSFGPDEDFLYFGTPDSPGWFLYVPKVAPRLEANLRVHDQSRSAFNFGTEMPVVYDREFTTEPIKLLGVPRDPRFRNTLRVYADAETFVTVEFNEAIHLITLRPGANLLEPAYAQFANFPIGAGTIDVTVRPSTAKVWAFISVTNNDTQLITTITPQR
jgi:hypothetical protein